MMRLLICLFLCLTICITVSGCASTRDNVDISDIDVNSHYSIEDFHSIKIGESTVNDVYRLAPTGESMQVTSYGGFCDYPMKNGGIVRIKFAGKDLVVSEIEEISPEDVTDIIY